MDAEIRAAASWQILDADSSQQAAIVAVSRGTNAVIDGPPGTGKSQTIANLIAQALAEGQRVLFVAEKAAALDVVRRRLDAAGLGRFVLELHSRKASKRAVLEGLRRALEDPIPASAAGAAPSDPRELEETRTRLASLREALHAPWSALARSPYRGIVRALALADAPEAPVEVPELEAWTRADLDAALEHAATLDRALTRRGDLATHPWRGAGLDRLDLETRQRVSARHRALAQALDAWRRAAGPAADAMGAAVPVTPADAACLAADAAFLVARPGAEVDAVLDVRWDGVADRLPAWLDDLDARERERQAFGAMLRPEAEAAAWDDVLDRRRRHGASFLRFLRPSWWRDRARLRAASVLGRLPDVPAQVRALEAVGRSRALRASLEARRPDLAAPFGARFAGLDAPDPAGLRRHAETVLALRAMLARRGVSIDAIRRFAPVEARASLAALHAPLPAAEAAAVAAAEGWLEAIAAPGADWFGRPWREVSFDALEARQRGLLDAFDRLQDHVDARVAQARLRTPRLAPFLAWASSPEASTASGRRAAALERQFERLWVDRALRARESLAAVSGDDLPALLDRFRRADVAWTLGTRTRLAALLASRRPAPEAGSLRETKLGLLKAEMRRKRGHLPLRRLFERAGEVVQAIAPCFMMSPISVAQYLAPGALTFDLVVFDEASQVEPADAYGAVARGRQLVLVGDENQLPPTSFFQRLEAASAAGSEEAAAGDLESVLTLGLTRLPERSRGALRWHYRSRDDSLIAFSNRAFYDGRLVTFPGPRTGRGEVGLSSRFVEGAVYRRGAGQDNPREARAVAEAVLAHAAREAARPPGERSSLGVGAFSVAQQTAIEDAIEVLRREAPQGPAEAFFDPEAEEPFFVKNLETIQGDERDVIFLSVGYGRDEAGKLTQNFGPLNQDGGWRRLNVLATRARSRCVLFHSFRASDLSLPEGAPRGVVALKDLLTYAEARGTTPAAELSSPAAAGEEGLEGDVAAALRARGHRVATHVGSSASCVDLAVLHPDDPTRYVLGVEVDGERWRDGATVRDRDRLWPEVLGRMGWALDRVSAADWWRRPEAVTERLSARLEGLRRDGPAGPAAEPSAVPPTPAAPAAAVGRAAGIVAESSAPLLPAGLVPYRRTTPLRPGRVETLLAARPERAAQEILSIVREEGPVHVDEALRVLAARYDARATARPREAFDRGLERAVAAGDVVRRGDFLWPKGLAESAVRWRGEGCPVTDPALIAAEELEAAVRATLVAEFGGPADAVIASTARRLGWSRTGPAVRSALASALEALLVRGDAVRDAQGDVLPARPRS